jgi:pilus assembly protein Flp/PilA
MMVEIHRFLKDERGATAIEYGLIAAIISGALIAGLTGVGNAIDTTFNTAAQHMKNSQ